MTRKTDSTLTRDLLRPVLETSPKFYVTVIVLALIVAAGFGTWFYQIYWGMGVTGDNWPVFWGLHETNFVFWIGISHAGTLISAILRIVNATWRRPVTRLSAEKGPATPSQSSCTSSFLYRRLTVLIPVLVPPQAGSYVERYPVMCDA